MATRLAGRDFPERIYAVAAPAGGAPLFDPGAVITADTVEQYLCSPDAVARAATALADAGFEVLQTTRLMVNFAGPPDLFEQAFATSLYTEEREVTKPGGVRALATFIDAEGSTLPGLIGTAGSAFVDVVTGVAIEEPYYPAAEPPADPEPPGAPGDLEPPDAAQPPAVDYWHLTLPDQLAAALHADGAHEQGVTGAGVRVAMVDTGFERHPFFAAHGFTVEPTVLGPGTAAPDVDENGHGTGEAANVFAAAAAATLLPVKAATASGALVNVTAAFNAAAALEPHVITNSWGSDQPAPPLSAANRALAAAVAGAVAEGIVVVFSARNGSWGFPGQHPDVISAGGAYLRPDGELQASDYASGFVSAVYPGRRVPDVSGLVGLLPGAMYLMLPVPPGSVIDRGNAGGTHPDGDETAPDDGWAAFSGTSAAAPQLAGVCALLAQAVPGLGPDQVREILMATARDVTTGTSHPAFGHPAGRGPDLATGSGLVDAGAALAAARALGADDDEEDGGNGSGAGTVVALVLLRHSGGGAHVAPSVAALQGELPAAETLTDVAAALVRSGFRPGPPSGPTFAIEASPEVFRARFGTVPVRAADGGWTTADGDELPLEALPEDLRAMIHAVVLERPADLH